MRSERVADRHRRLHQPTRCGKDAVLQGKKAPAAAAVLALPRARKGHGGRGRPPRRCQATRSRSGRKRLALADGHASASSARCAVRVPFFFPGFRDCPLSAHPTIDPVPHTEPAHSPHSSVRPPSVREKCNQRSTCRRRDNTVGSMSLVSLASLVVSAAAAALRRRPITSQTYETGWVARVVTLPRFRCVISTAFAGVQLEQCHP